METPLLDSQYVELSDSDRMRTTSSSRSFLNNEQHEKQPHLRTFLRNILHFCGFWVKLEDVRGLEMSIQRLKKEENLKSNVIMDYQEFRLSRISFSFAQIVPPDCFSCRGLFKVACNLFFVIHTIALHTIFWMTDGADAVLWLVKLVIPTFWVIATYVFIRVHLLDCLDLLSRLVPGESDFETEAKQSTWFFCVYLSITCFSVLIQPYGWNFPPAYIITWFLVGVPLQLWQSASMSVIVFLTLIMIRKTSVLRSAIMRRIAQKENPKEKIAMLSDVYWRLKTSLQRVSWKMFMCNSIFFLHLFTFLLWELVYVNFAILFVALSQILFVLLLFSKVSSSCDELQRFVIDHFPRYCLDDLAGMQKILFMQDNPAGGTVLFTRVDPRLVWRFVYGLWLIMLYVFQRNLSIQKT